MLPFFKKHNSLNLFKKALLILSVDFCSRRSLSAGGSGASSPLFSLRGLP
jgi:hypothetical protein